MYQAFSNIILVKNKLKKGSSSYLLILRPLQDVIKTCFQPWITVIELTLANALILAMCVTLITLQFLRIQSGEEGSPDQNEEAG